MNSEVNNAGLASKLRLPCARVALSRWVNERPLAWQDILSAHDVARLTRRPNWLLCGLALVGRFPRKCQYRGRRIGWMRTDVLDWMKRELTIERADHAPEFPVRRCANRHSPQRCLPLYGMTPCRTPRGSRAPGIAAKRNRP